MDKSDIKLYAGGMNREIHVAKQALSITYSNIIVHYLRLIEWMPTYYLSLIISTTIYLLTIKFMLNNLINSFDITIMCVLIFW